MNRAEDIFNKIIDNKEPEIDNFIVNRQSEELFLDFKRSSDNGSSRNLSQIDRNNLAKAISGFGNSEGGVVVWGVDCSRDVDGADVARLKYPIENVARFVSLLEGAVSGCTIPPHIGVRSYPIKISDDGKGFVITHIPKSNDVPHQVVGKLQYYIRAGSDFVPTPHQVLAGMFGRRPQPRIYLQYPTPSCEIYQNSLRSQLGFLVKNDGLGIAADTFINIWIISTPGDNCNFEIVTPDTTNWTGYWSFGRHMSLICKPDFRLPPGAHVQPLIIKFNIQPPIIDGLKITGTAGSTNCPPYKFNLENSKENIQSIYDSYMNKVSVGNLSKKDLQGFVGLIFNI